jgi:hypothetical protein
MVVLPAAVIAMQETAHRSGRLHYWLTARQVTNSGTRVMASRPAANKASRHLRGQDDGVPPDGQRRGRAALAREGEAPCGTWHSPKVVTPDRDLHHYCPLNPLTRNPRLLSPLPFPLAPHASRSSAGHPGSARVSLLPQRPIRYSSCQSGLCNTTRKRTCRKR